MYEPNFFHTDTAKSITAVQTQSWQKHSVAGKQNGPLGLKGEL